MLTLSIIKADTGGFVGHSSMHPEMLDVARRAVEGVVGDLLINAQVAHCGDDLHLVMTQGALPRDHAQRRRQEGALRAELEAFLAGAPALDADRARARESLAMLGAADG